MNETTAPRLEDVYVDLRRRLPDRIGEGPFRFDVRGGALLDAGRVDSTENELDLEHVAENAGVGEAEARFWLPGADFWDEYGLHE